MKKTFILILSALAFASCNDKGVIDDGGLVSPRCLYMPRDGYTLDIATGQNLILEWERSNGGNVRYQVVFDKPDGDFSSPLYAVMSNNSGFVPSATLTPTSLTSVARLAGAEPGESASVKWTVRTFLGLDAVTGTLEGSPRTLCLLRPIVMEEIPLSVSLSGSAVEGGSREMEHFLPLTTDENRPAHTRSSDSFASYLQMGNGDLLLTDNNDIKYILSEGGTIKVYNGSASTTSLVPAGLTRLTVNFGTLSWEAVKVTNVWFWNYPWFDQCYQTRMDYQGNGVWKASMTFHTSKEGHDGNDSRYHIRMDMADGSCDRLGYSKKDSSSSADVINAEGYYNVYRYLDSFDQWNWSWKTPGDSGDGKNATATLTMRGETYTHSISIEP